MSLTASLLSAVSSLNAVQAQFQITSGNIANVNTPGYSRKTVALDNQVIDGSIDTLSNGTVASGRLLSNLHLGMIQYRLLVMFVIVVFLALYFFF